MLTFIFTSLGQAHLSTPVILQLSATHCLSPVTLFTQESPEARLFASLAPRCVILGPKFDAQASSLPVTRKTEEKGKGGEEGRKNKDKTEYNVCKEQTSIRIQEDIEGKKVKSVWN